jgi:hypothetical protein
MRSSRSLAAVLTLGLAVLVSSPALAGRIFGDIRLDGKPLPEGVKLKVTNPATAAVVDTTVTDKFGSFKLMVKGEGKFMLTVIYEKQPVELAVFSNKEATRYDLVIEKKDGKLLLRRK